MPRYSYRDDPIVRVIPVERGYIKLRKSGSGSIQYKPHGKYSKYNPKNYTKRK